MKARKTYLSGRSVFTVSCIVIVITILTVYLTGINYNRSVTSNLYLSLTIISSALLFFLTYGLYKGVDLINNFPKFRGYKRGEILTFAEYTPEFGSFEVDDSIEGIIAAILLWIGMTILLLVSLVVLEAIFWVSFFILITMLYWVFFRALKLVFSKSSKTKGNLLSSINYAFLYTMLYSGWIYGIVFLSQLLH